MGGTTPLSGGTQTVNLTPVGGTGVVATMTAGTPGSSTVTVTLALSEGATLVTWTLQKRGRADSGSAWSSWSNVATGITATDYDVTGLEPSPAQYEFQAIDVVTEMTTTSNVVSVETAEAPTTVPAYNVIMSALGVSENNLNKKAWAVAIRNKSAYPIKSIRLTGRNTRSGHGQISGLWLVGGTVNTSTFSGTTYQRVTFGGSDTYTPANGTQTSPVFWASDRMTLTTPLDPEGVIIIRGQTMTGYVSACLDFTRTSRPNYADVVSMGFATPDGDYGSTLELVQTNPAWNTNINTFLASIELEYDSPVTRPLAAHWGDSVAAGFINGTAARDSWTKACETAMVSGRIVSHGIPGATTTTYCSALRAWLQTPSAAIYDSVGLTPWSWNNLDANFSVWQAQVTTAITAIQNAGKRAFVWIPVPSGLVSGGNGNNTTWTQARAWAQSSGLPLIETWQDVADGGVGPAIAATYTADGVHLNTTGQSTQQGPDIGAAEAVVFG